MFGSGPRFNTSGGRVQRVTVIDEQTEDVDTRDGDTLVCPSCKSDKLLPRYESAMVRCQGRGDMVGFEKLVRADGRPRR